jgi:hypothetical protein
MQQLGRSGGHRPTWFSKRHVFLLAALVVGSATVFPSLTGFMSSAKAASAAPLPKTEVLQTEVSALSASPATLTPAGGTATLSATVKRATSCTFTGSSPAQGGPITGIPVSVPCTNGLVSITVGVPGNECCALLRYRFHLVVSGTPTRMKRRSIQVPPATTIDCNADLAPYADFEGCDFSGGSIVGDFPGIIFQSANLTHTTFSGSFEMADFTDSISPEASFADSDLSGASFGGATLTDVDFEGTNLTDAIGLYGDDLSTVIWGDTTCPDGTNSDNDGGTCVGHLLFA